MFYLENTAIPLAIRVNASNASLALANAKIALMVAQDTEAADEVIIYRRAYDAANSIYLIALENVVTEFKKYR